MEWLVFALGTIVVLAVSWRPLRNFRAHGFYRFFAWEILLGLFALNASGWFADPLAWHQLISWVMLIASVVLVVWGMLLLRRVGQQDGARGDPALLGMEKTARLVTNGLYRYIRHPLYSSLLFLGWGMFFKSPSWLDGGLALLCTLFLFATARVEEWENIKFFGAEYSEYMQHSKMFVPFIL